MPGPSGPAIPATEGRSNVKPEVDITTLVCWLVANSLLTVCLGLFLAGVCLFPSWTPSALRTLLLDGTVAPLLPYIIFSLIAGSLLSVSFYRDTFRM